MKVPPDFFVSRDTFVAFFLGYDGPMSKKPTMPPSGQAIAHAAISNFDMAAFLCSAKNVASLFQSSE